MDTGWLRGVARDMVREAVTAQCAELGADFALADTGFTSAFTYAACRLVYEPAVRPLLAPLQPLHLLLSDKCLARFYGP